jgi:hypothetical protein
MVHRSFSPPATNAGFAGLPLHRLATLRDRYRTLYATDPAVAAYSAAALLELEAAIAAAWATGGAA